MKLFENHYYRLHESFNYSEGGVGAASDTGHLRSIQRDLVSLAKRNWRNFMWHAKMDLSAFLCCKVNT